MSSLFYDHLLNLDKIETEIKKVSKTREESIELWSIVDEIIHHRVLGCVLEKLPKKYHREFLDLFGKNPRDEKLLNFLKEKMKKDIEMIIKEAISIFVLEVIGGFEKGASKKKIV